MKQLCLALVFLLVPVAPAIDDVLSRSWDSIMAPGSPWNHSGARAQEADLSAKEAFDLTREIGTAEAWRAFIKAYPAGFRANLARAYLLKLAGGAADAPQADAPPQPQADAPPASAPAKAAASPAPAVPAARPAAAPPATPAAVAGSGVAATAPGKPAVVRGSAFMGFPEKFNRYYTDPAWQPLATVYVSAKGSGDGATRDKPMAAQTALAAARAGTRIVFLAGAYPGGYELTRQTSGTYDAPIVLYAERNQDKSTGVTMACGGARQTCINLEAADYVAVDGFELVGGKFGVRAVGEGYAASAHSRGVAVLNSTAHDQDRDPLFSGQADWAVWESNIAYGAKKGDGHGIYLSNGGDWNIVRFNETFSNVSSDFQINAAPLETCKEVGIPVNDSRCDAYAGEGEGGQGASDYFLVDGNYFHHGLANGANFTSVRRSVVRNNIFGLHTEKHNVSFWQETDNPKLGSSDNTIVHNLFVTTRRHGIKFENYSTRNEFANNVIIGVKLGGGTVTANPSALLMEVDDTVAENIYRSNFYSSGTFEGRQPNEQESAGTDFSAAWFAKFPAALNHNPNDFTPAAAAPFLGKGALSANAPADRNGVPRAGAVDLGPIEVK